MSKNNKKYRKCHWFKSLCRNPIAISNGNWKNIGLGNSSYVFYERTFRWGSKSYIQERFFFLKFSVFFFFPSSALTFCLPLIHDQEKYKIALSTPYPTHCAYYYSPKPSSFFLPSKSTLPSPSLYLFPLLSLCTKVSFPLNQQTDAFKFPFLQTKKKKNPDPFFFFFFFFRIMEFSKSDAQMETWRRTWQWW